MASQQSRENVYKAQRDQFFNALEMDEKQLMQTPTKELNERLKSSGYSQEVIKVIKAQRRTMLNRRYARLARARVKRDQEVCEYKVGNHINSNENHRRSPTISNSGLMIGCFLVC